MLTAKVLYTLSAAITVATGAVVDEATIPLPDQVLDAFGIAMGWPQLMAGMCFAVAGGFVALAMQPPDDRMDKWVTLFAAMLIGLLAAIMHPHIPVIDNVPSQAFMLIAGLASKKSADTLRGLDMPFPGLKK